MSNTISIIVMNYRFIKSKLVNPALHGSTKKFNTLMSNDQISKQTKQTDRTVITTLINIPAYIFISPAPVIEII